MKKSKPKKSTKPNLRGQELIGEIDAMPGEAFKAALVKLYGTEQCQSAFARLIGVSDRSVRSWIAEVYPVPKVIAQLVNLMLKTKTAPGDLKPA